MGSRFEIILKSAKQHPIVLLIVVLAACAAFLTETPKDVVQIGRWLLLHSTDRGELKLLEQIDTGLSRRKVEDFLGVPTTELKGGHYDTAAYVRPLYRIALIYERETVVAFSIMTRRRGFNPKIRVGEDHLAILGRTTFSEFLPSHLSVVKWEASAVPKDIMYYEAVYLGNAKNYETCLLAYSWSLGAKTRFDQNAVSWLDEIPMEIILDREINLTENQKHAYCERLRKTSVPNIVGFSRLHVAGEIPDDVGFDVNRTLIYAATEVSEGGLRLIK